MSNLHPGSQYTVSVCAFNTKGRSEAIVLQAAMLRLPEKQLTFEKGTYAAAIERRFGADVFGRGGQMLLIPLGTVWVVSRASLHARTECVCCEMRPYSPNMLIKCHLPLPINTEVCTENGTVRAIRCDFLIYFVEYNYALRTKSSVESGHVIKLDSFQPEWFFADFSHYIL